MFSILNEINDNSPRRTTAVVTSSIGTAGFIYLLVAITGYLSFGNTVAGNIVAQCMFRQAIELQLMGNADLSSTDIPSIASTIGKAAIVVLVMFSYPLQVHPCRASVDAVLKWRPYGRTSSDSTPASGSPSRGPLMGQSGKPGTKPGRGEMSETRFAAITTAIIILSYIVAMTVSSLEKVLAYVGSTGSTAISFILPGLFYYKISAPESPHHQRLMKEDDDEEFGSDDEVPSSAEEHGWSAGWRAKHWRRDLLRRLSLALAIYGLVVMITCLITNTFFIAAAH